MPHKPPYIIRTDEQEEGDAEDIDQAMEIAAAMYDPSAAVPEIVDDDGNVVHDQSFMAARIMEILSGR